MNPRGTRQQAAPKVQLAKPKQQEEQIAQPGEAYSEEDYYRAAIGKNADYYLGKFAEIKETWTLTGNLAAFLVTSPWLLYRKMYFYYFLYIFLAVPIQIVGSISLWRMMGELGMITDESTAKGAELLANLLFSLLYMGVANVLYKRHIDKSIQQAKNLYSEPEEIKAHLERTGGANVIACVIGCIIVFLIIAINKATFG